MKYACHRVENIVGTGQNADHQHFLLFPQCFQKATFYGFLKDGLVLLGFNVTGTAKVISWHTCVTWLSNTNTYTTFFLKPLTTFLKCFRGERRKKVCLNQVSNSQPPGHESDTLTTEPPRRGVRSRDWVVKR